MPNWNSNIVKISHEDAEMMNRVKSSFNEGRLLEEFIPVPAELKITAGRVGDNNDENQIALEKQMEENREKCGYSTWYDFCINQWGCKWDISPWSNYNEDGDNVTLSFDTPWGPPIQAYEKLVEMGFTIRAYYYESGMAFCGIWEDGNDEYYELSDYANADAVAESIPEELDEMFCISENMREWEEEMAEEENETPHEFNTEGKFTIEE